MGESGLRNDGLLERGNQLGIVRQGAAGETGDHPTLGIHHILAEVPARSLALRGQLLEQRDGLLATYRLGVSHAEGHTVIDVADLGSLFTAVGFLAEVVRRYAQ